MTNSGEREQASPGKRLYFLDHIRVVVILLVIVIHTSMTYMVAAPEWWYVIEPKNSLVFTALVLGLDVVNMQLLFFIAGFFAYGSLERYGARRFFRQKLVHIGLPWIAGVVLLAPLTTYLITVTRGIAKPYLTFWLTDFWGPYYQQSVYWFLGILLALFVMLAAVINSDSRLQHLERRVAQPSWRTFTAFWAAMTLWFFLCSTAVPADTWNSSLKVLVFQPARLLLYAGYFSLGVYADRKGWLRANGYQPDIQTWLPVALICGGAYLAFRLTWAGGSDWLALAVQAILFNAFCLSGVLAVLGIFQRYFNQPTPAWSSLARNSFAIYYVHPLILYPAAYQMLFVDTSIFIKAALLIGFTSLAGWAIGALVLTRLPGLRDIF